MSSNQDTNKARPFSADVSRLTKVRLQSSNCPTIVKHEVTSPTDGMPFLGSPAEKSLVDRPRTANSNTKLKLAFLQSMRPLSSPMSAVSIRPQSGAMNSTINFDFVNAIGKSSSGKFQDRSKIKPMKKLDTDAFHNIIYKVKQQKELLEKDINRMEQWQKEIKENDIWNTPQTAIIDSILKMNAKTNPDGSVSRYLQNEKDKEEAFRNSRKFSQRPSSSFAYQSGRISKKPKSVKDFFKNEDNEEVVIEEILSSKNPYYTEYENNKRRITEKINTYVDNYNNNSNVLKPNNKEARPNTSSSSARDHIRNVKPYEASIRESASEQMYFGEEHAAKSISEIVESPEGSEISPSNFHKIQEATYSKTSQGFNSGNGFKGRPVSAKISVNTVLSPKNFAPAILKQFSSPQGPVVIHSRPHTAKNMRVQSPGSVITNSLVANGEIRQPSISSVKYLPFRLEGQKLGLGAENVDVNAYNEMMNSAKNLHGGQFTSPNKSISSTKNIQAIWPGSSSFKVTPTKDFEIGRAMSRGGQPRIKSAKRDSRPNTASSQGLEVGLSLGKVNIDGQYLVNFVGSRTPLGNY